MPADFAVALTELRKDSSQISIRAIDEHRIGGYLIVPDIFGEPLFVLRVEAPRPIYARGKLSQRYLLLTLLGGALTSSIAIIFLLQRFVVARISRLSSQVTSIGRRKALAERVQVQGNDELTMLQRNINGMLEDFELSQANFLFLTENIHQVFWVRNALTGHFDFVSRASNRIWGGSSELLLGKSSGA